MSQETFAKRIWRKSKKENWPSSELYIPFEILCPICRGKEKCQVEDYPTWKADVCLEEFKRLFMIFAQANDGKRFLHKILGNLPHWMVVEITDGEGSWSDL